MGSFSFNFICFVLGGFCLIYYFVMIGYAGIKAAFSGIWLFMTIIFWGVAVCCKIIKSKEIIIPKGVLLLLIGIFLIGVIIMLIVENTIINAGTSEPKPKADYLIVLGAKVNGSKPSKTLKARVCQAAVYLKENKDTIVIVSGGQGKDEDVTEAFAMKQLLLENGLEENRIRMEEKSVNTEQNIRFSKELMEKENPTVVIATSNFHLYRGMEIAKKQGFQKVSGCPAKPDPILMVHYYFREFFAVVKDKLAGNI